MQALIEQRNLITCTQSANSFLSIHKRNFTTKLNLMISKTIQTKHPTVRTQKEVVTLTMYMDMYSWTYYGLLNIHVDMHQSL